MRLILASASPRRRQLLADAGVTFEVMPAEIDESLLPSESPAAAVERLGCAKAAAVSAHCPGDRVLAADTAVVLDEMFLGKPADAAEAVSMLTRLSGREHEVMTGYALQGPGESVSGLCRTRVRFRELSAEEIRAYTATGEPMDKAGAYGIQAGAAHMVLAITGSYTNVVGLPMAEIMMLLARR